MKLQVKKWQCSLCKQLLPADNLQDVRKRRHEERHMRHGHNNIVFGTVTWNLVVA